MRTPGTMSLVAFSLKVVLFLSISWVLSKAVLHLDASSVLQQSDNDLDLSWRNFKTKFNKTYAMSRSTANQDEESIRREIFNKRSKEIEQHNLQMNKTYTMKINKFSDYTDEELKGLTGTGPIEMTSTLGGSEITPILNQIRADKRPVPDSVDWTQVRNRVGPVKDQNEYQTNCGSCWAFATTGLLEGQLCEHTKLCKTNNVIQLSEQHLLDCSGGTCSGFDPHRALVYVKRHGGMETSKNYTYKGIDNQICKSPSKSMIHFNISSIEYLSSNDELFLKKVVAFYGPVLVAFSVSPKFVQYHKGIFTDYGCYSHYTNHAVLIVGYGDEDDVPYWLVKNSWGSQWGGYGGYFKMARSSPSNCGLTQNAIIAWVDHEDLV